MSASSLVSVSMATVSTWMAPTNVPVTTVTRSHQTKEAAKVCRELCWVVGGQHTSLWCSSVSEWCLHSMSFCQMSTSVRSVTPVLEACASTPLVPTFVRTAGSDLNLLPTDWVAKVRSAWIRPSYWVAWPCLMLISASRCGWVFSGELLPWRSVCQHRRILQLYPM